ncbi:MAG: hypothetical protein QOH64_3267 [Acidimicrobiaceae bacterium]|jgi:hypothetical protein
MADERGRHDDDEIPDGALFWRWVGKATRPVLGWVLLGLGALFILIGWIGVSGTPVLAKQIPYVVSGGIAGVFLAVAGAYFLGTEELRKDSGRLDRLERMVQELHEALLTRSDAPAPAATAASTNGKVSYVALAGSDTYHRADCSMVANKSNTAVLAPSSITRRKLQPCPLCDPVAVETN